MSDSQYRTPHHANHNYSAASAGWNACLPREISTGPCKDWIRAFRAWEIRRGFVAKTGRPKSVFGKGLPLDKPINHK